MTRIKLIYVTPEELQRVLTRLDGLVTKVGEIERRQDGYRVYIYLKPWKSAANPLH